MNDLGFIDCCAWMLLEEELASASSGTARQGFDRAIGPARRPSLPPVGTIISQTAALGSTVAYHHGARVDSEVSNNIVPALLPLATKSDNPDYFD